MEFKSLIIAGYFFGFIASKVASIPFEQFHKHSADIITAAVFGKNADGEVNNEVVFATIFCFQSHWHSSSNKTE